MFFIHFLAKPCWTEVPQVFAKKINNEISSCERCLLQSHASKLVLLLGQASRHYSAHTVFTLHVPSFCVAHSAGHATKAGLISRTSSDRYIS